MFDNGLRFEALELLVETLALELLGEETLALELLGEETLALELLGEETLALELLGETLELEGGEALDVLKGEVFGTGEDIEDDVLIKGIYLHKSIKQFTNISKRFFISPLPIGIIFFHLSSFLK